MDNSYSNVFETLFSEFPVLHDFRNDFPLLPTESGSVTGNLREVRNFIIAEANNPTSKKVRPDAKLFLIANYYHMVLLPVLMNAWEQEKRFPIDDTFKTKINQDITIILTEASRISSDEVSSHSVLRAISEKWNQLFTTVQMSWSNSNEY